MTYCLASVEGAGDEVASGEKGRISTWVGVVGGVIGAVSGLYTFMAQVRPGKLAIYPHGIFDYAAPSLQRCNNKVLEIITVPVTFVNEGGRSNIVSNIHLELQNVSDNGRARRFIASGFGTWRPGSDSCADLNTMKAFAPIMIKGGEAVRETVVFYPKPSREITSRLVSQNHKFRASIWAEEYRSAILGAHEREARPLQHPALSLVVGPYTEKEAESGGVSLYDPDQFSLSGSK